MGYLSLRQTAEKWGISIRRVQRSAALTEFLARQKSAHIGLSLLMQKSLTTSEFAAENM